MNYLIVYYLRHVNGLLLQSVTLGDEEATRRGGTKTVLERKGPPTFTCGAEIVSKTEVRVHRSLEATVDALLAGSLLDLLRLHNYINYFDTTTKLRFSVNLLVLTHHLAKRSLTKR